MPDLQQIINKRNEKKFTKKPYRPWDLSGNTASLPAENELNKAEANSLVQRYESGTQTKTAPICNDNQIIDEAISKIDNNKGNNKVSIGYPLDNEIENNQISKRYLKDNNKGTNRYHIDNHSDNNLLSENIISTDRIYVTKNDISHVNNNISMPVQPEIIDSFPSNIEQEIIRLSGKQKIVFNMIMEVCLTRNSNATGPVKTASLATLAQTTIGTVKTTIKRLIDKQLIVRYQGKNAKGGYINLGITSEILNHADNIKNNNKLTLFASEAILTNRYQTDINQDTNSSSINNITTTNNKRSEQIPYEWENINFEPLTHIGFSKTQIKQMIGKNEPANVQESIYHFAYGLEYNSKVKKYEDPLNVLMGVLRKGQVWVETDYRSSVEIAQQKLLEAKKAEIERRKALEEEAFKLAFKDWEEEIPEIEKEKITERKNGDITPAAAKLSKYFRDHIWPLKKGEYLLF